MITKYDLQQHIYSGYAIPLQQFNDLLRQIPGYKNIMDRSKFTTYDTHIIYPKWKRECLSREVRKKAPHIMVYWDGDDKNVEGSQSRPRVDYDDDDEEEEEEEVEDSFTFRLTHVLILIRAIPFKENAQVNDPDHEDAPKVRLEKETDRLARERFVKFFKSQGAKDMNTEDFVWTWSVGPHPRLLMD